MPYAKSGFYPENLDENICILKHLCCLFDYNKKADPDAPGSAFPFIYFSCYFYFIIGTIRSATMLMTLIIGLIAGPAVSLYGSPTVSPVTEALCPSLPFL